MISFAFYWPTGGLSKAKKKKKVGGEVFIFCKFWRTCSTRGTVLDTGDAKMNKTDAVCFFRANSIAGKAVIKQLITG